MDTVITKPVVDCQTLADVRAAIDALDRQIVALIGQRAPYVRAAAKFKTTTAEVQAAERVAAMVQQRRVWAEEAGVSPDLIEALFREMVRRFTQEELHHWEAVAITGAAEADLDAILALQKLAYRSEAERYSDFTLPPLRQTPEEIRADFARMTFFKATSGERIVGSVRGYEKDGTCYIGRLIVHPDVQNRGIGARLLQTLEQHFSTARRFELFTGHKSEPALHLYHKLGYREFKRQEMATHTIVFLEKA
ncbi:MAG TPA: GNAT family N-acetyltransferase [Anaerolineae bacterium]|nr:GNAT family N-acetyltransferase [Anaerolineae bacterium]